MSFTIEQQEVINQIKSFLKQDENKVCLLDAPGGVGKTFTIKHFKNSALFLTPTNQAKKILQNQDIFNVHTIARFLKMEMIYDEEGKEIPIYNGFDSYLLKDLKFIIIDECSMITQAQLDALLLAGCHILFAGDKCQIGPIKCEDVCSPVYNITPWKILSLTKNIRTDNLLLQKINNHYRNVVKQIKSVKPDLSTVTIQKQNVANLFEIGKDIRLVSYKNSTVDKWNQLIRKKLFITNHEEKFVLGEKLLVNDFIQAPLAKYYTGDFFYVEDIREIEKIYKYEFCKCDKCKKYISKKNLHLDSIDVSIQTYEITNNNNIFYSPIDDNNFKLLFKIFSAKKCRIKNTEGSKTDLWKSLYNWWKTENVPLIYPYATTIHKSQGSGFKTVIFDQEGLYYNDISRKLRYVAVSRAKEELFIIEG